MNINQTRKLTIIAQDPGVRHHGRILTTQVEIPAEQLAPGPRGYRVHVIDYDSTSRTMYKPMPMRLASKDPLDSYVDFFSKASDSKLLGDPHFHAQNVYAIAMRVLARFEFALGRRVSWGFGGHQIKIAPHAFADANAFYSRRDQGMFFGYFVSPRSGHSIFSCLSHDVVAHETTHALLDGLRSRYLDPSSADQAAFHEALADIVALLSVFSLRDVVRTLIDANQESLGNRAKGVIATRDLTKKALSSSVLFTMADEMGSELSSLRGKALRASYDLEPNPDYLSQSEFVEPHRRGEILVASVLRTYMESLADRLSHLGEVKPGYVDRDRVVEEAADLADYLLTMSIRAIDYCPAVHVTFGDFLSAALTADRDIHSLDDRFQCRKHMRHVFATYGIVPSSKNEDGFWEGPESALVYRQSRFESMQRDPDEVFRFIWENREALNIAPDAYSQVLSVRPCLRIGPDGFYLRETVAEYVQILDLQASELRSYELRKPEDMPNDTQVRLYGGGVLLFDEYGSLKYHIRNRLLNSELQSLRIQHLWSAGAFSVGSVRRRRFANLHRMRASQSSMLAEERWYNDGKEDIETEVGIHHH